MNMINVLKNKALLGIMALVLPMAAFAASGMPQFSLQGVQHVTGTSATAYVLFNSAGSTFGPNDRPVISVQYTNTSTGVAANSGYNNQSAGNQVNEFVLYGLTPNTTYSYRALMIFNGSSYVTQDATFTTRANITESVSTDSDTPDATWETPAWVKWFTSGNAKDAVLDKVATGGAARKNNVAMAITNEQARVARLDTFEYTIKYTNANTASLKNAKVVVKLPEQYEFVKSSDDADYDRDTNTVTFIIGRVSANQLHSVTFTARAIGAGNGEVETQATFSSDKGTLVASDRDTYDSGSKSVLGASVFGAGFFPQTLGGWMLIIIVIALIIIVARRSMTKPAPDQVKPEDKKPA